MRFTLYHIIKRDLIIEREFAKIDSSNIANLSFLQRNLISRYQLFNS